MEKIEKVFKKNIVLTASGKVLEIKKHGEWLCQRPLKSEIYSRYWNIYPNIEDNDGRDYNILIFLQGNERSVVRIKASIRQEYFIPLGEYLLTLVRTGKNVVSSIVYELIDRHGEHVDSRAFRYGQDEIPIEAVSSTGDVLDIRKADGSKISFAVVDSVFQPISVAEAAARKKQKNNLPAGWRSVELAEEDLKKLDL